MLTRKMLVVSLTLFAAAVLAQAGPVVYVVNLTNQFGTVDLGTGAFHQIGPNTPEPMANLVPAPNGSFYSLSTVSGSLTTINPVNGATHVVGATGLGPSAFGLAEASGKLYATDFSNNLYTVDPTTGSANLIGATGIPPDPTIPFTMNADGTLNLCDETLYGVGGNLYATFDSFKIDPTTLATTTAVSPALYRINPSTGLATMIGPTDLKLGASVDVNGTFYAFRLVPLGFSAGPEANSQLVTLDLATGETAFVRNIDPAASGILGAAPAVPEPSAAVLAGIGMAAIGLSGRRRRKPRTAE